jgi:RNA polymerase sigma-70 factor (ECF subfamily)
MDPTATAEFLEELVRTHWREVRGMLVAVTGNAATAEDLAQDVFVLALRKGLKPGAGMGGWLRKAARFLALNERRRRRPFTLEPDELIRLADETPAEPAEPAPRFEDELAALKRCLAELKESDRSLLAAKYGNGAALAGLALAERQSVGYIKQRLFRLRRRLGDCVRRRVAEEKQVHG